ncbi:hypothetical protein OIU85_028211 [Salix viminalis]|uniref:Uncharacterized protein n=1 Tax=Salix viminalis TaxID=40686 RepID=A0A9Q0TBU4_SALVM|nr:hypothetical protein OIU85_028211 [Salix viminalis]
MENQAEEVTFDMDALRANLPQKKGLSRYYSGKSRSFTRMADVQCLEDLKKPERPGPKKRKKFSDRKDLQGRPYPMSTSFLHDPTCPTLCWCLKTTEQACWVPSAIL